MSKISSVIDAQQFDQETLERIFQITKEMEGIKSEEILICSTMYRS